MMRQREDEWMLQQCGLLLQLCWFLRVCFNQDYRRGYLSMLSGINTWGFTISCWPGVDTNTCLKMDSSPEKNGLKRSRAAHIVTACSYDGSNTTDTERFSHFFRVWCEELYPFVTLIFSGFYLEVTGLSGWLSVCSAAGESVTHCAVSHLSLQQPYCC